MSKASILSLLATRTSSQVNFPIDFFEHNQQLTDVEFGGNDLLQVYNAQQIKHRLNSTGMYVANTKVNGGSLGIPLGSQVMLLSRVMVLLCDLSSAAWRFYHWSYKQQQHDGDDRHADPDRHTSNRESTLIPGDIWPHYAAESDQSSLVWLPFHSWGSLASRQKANLLQ